MLLLTLNGPLTPLCVCLLLLLALPERTAGGGIGGGAVFVPLFIFVGGERSAVSTPPFAACLPEGAWGL
jgi:hypothetical protein